VEALSSVLAGRARDYLPFRLARNDFAVEAARVRGILAARDFKAAPPAPQLLQFLGDRLFAKWNCGFATFCGRDVPVIDLRGLLHLPHATHGRRPYIIVVEIATPEGPWLTGFIADRVSAVVHVRDRDLSEEKVKVRGRSRRLLNPDRLLNPA
jgi:chemotaxis signal transduction protein